MLGKVWMLFNVYDGYLYVLTAQVPVPSVSAPLVTLETPS